VGRTRNEEGGQDYGQQPQAKMDVSPVALRAFGSKQASCPFVSSRFHLAGQARHHFGWVRQTLSVYRE